MDYTELTRYSVTIASISLVIGLYHQIYKMFKTKSADDFSILMIVALLICQVTWINYGLVLDEWPILLISIAELPTGVLALIGYYKFRNKNELSNN